MSTSELGTVKDSAYQLKEGGDSMSHSGSLSHSPPSLNLTASGADPVQRQEADLGFTPGALTIEGEGAGDNTLHLHWPGNAASGVTVGYGYDMGDRTAGEIRGHAEAAGISAAQISILEGAAGKKGNAADTYVDNNTAAFGSITKAQRVSLFQNILPAYEARAEGRATEDFYGAGAVNSNPDWQLTQDQWDALHPAIHELLTDLTFQGAYKSSDNWGGSYARINPILVSTDDNITKMENLVAALQDYLTGDNLPSGAPRRTNLRISMLQGAITAARAAQPAPAEPDRVPGQPF